MNEQSENTHTPEEQPEGIAPSIPGDRSPLTQPAGRFKPDWKFAAGFLGWYLVMALVFWLSFGNTFKLSGEEGPMMINGLCILPTQVLVLIFLFWVKELRMIGWGMLSAIGANLLISLILGLVGNALCFVPFFAPLF